MPGNAKISRERWENMHISEFQSLSARLLPSHFPSCIVDRLHRLGAIARDREEQGKQRRHGSALHYKYYLQYEALAEKHDPELVQLLRQTMEEIDAEEWGLVQRETLEGCKISVRLLEYHYYEEGGHLTLGFDQHYDGGSLLTMVVLLSDVGKDYEGGVLKVSDEATWQLYNETYKPAGLRHAGDAVVFPSHKFHNVSEVTKGRRHTAVMELWNDESGPGRVDDRPGAKIVHFV